MEGEIEGEAVGGVGEEMVGSGEEGGVSKGRGTEMGNAWRGGWGVSEEGCGFSRGWVGKTAMGEASGGARTIWVRGKAGMWLCRTSVRGERRAEARGRVSGVEGVSWTRRVLDWAVTRREEESRRLGGRGIWMGWWVRVEGGMVSRREKRIWARLAAFSARSAGGGMTGREVASRGGAEARRVGEESEGEGWESETRGVPAVRDGAMDGEEGTGAMGREEGDVGETGGGARGVGEGAMGDA